jgi:hypothetical protein
MKTNALIFNIVLIIVAVVICYPFVMSWWQAEMVKVKYEELPVEQRNLVKAIEEIKEAKAENKELNKTWQDSLIRLEARKDVEKDNALEMVKQAYDEKLKKMSHLLKQSLDDKKKVAKELKNRADSLAILYKKQQIKYQKVEDKLKQTYKRLIILYRDSVNNARNNIDTTGLGLINSFDNTQFIKSIDDIKQKKLLEGFDGKMPPLYTASVTSSVNGKMTDEDRRIGNTLAFFFGLTIAILLLSFFYKK